MKIIFIDESERQTNKNNYFFALCGLIIDCKDVIEIEEKLRKLKENYKLTNLKELKSKTFDKKEKIQISKEIFDIIEEGNSTILSAILGSIALRDEKTLKNRHFDAITFIVERFYMRLQRENENGIVIHDSIEKTEERELRENFYKFIDSEKVILMGKDKGNLKTRIYPSILFSNDGHSEILQATDLIATSLNSAVWKCLESESELDIENLFNYNFYLKTYWPLFDKSYEGKINGWGIKVWW